MIATGTVRQVARLPRPRPQHPAERLRGSERPRGDRALPGPHQGPGRRPAALGEGPGGAPRQRRPARGLRRRHPGRGTRMGAPVRELRPDQPRHAAPRDPAVPPPLVLLPEGTALRRDRRVPHLPGRLGSDVAQGLRRLRRLCARYGADPVSRSPPPPRRIPRSPPGASPACRSRRCPTTPPPRGELVFALWEPPLTDLHGEKGAPVRRTATAETADLLTDLTVQGVRSVAFVRSRRGAELISVIAKERLAEVDRSLPSGSPPTAAATSRRNAAPWSGPCTPAAPARQPPPPSNSASTSPASTPSSSAATRARGLPLAAGGPRRPVGAGRPGRPGRP
ncbi:hypothetical protein SMICM17S_05983 [Streptomyces microflavus]